MTDQEEMQVIVEAADECYHVAESYYDGDLELCKCWKCGVQILTINAHIATPSPTDLNELFSLAGKLNIGIIAECMPCGNTVSLFKGSGSYLLATTHCEDNASNALRKALVQAIAHET